MPRRTYYGKRDHEAGPPPPDEATALRIIGGKYRGRKFHHSGDPRTRPMKERVREAVFNLVGPAVEGMYAVDLFAGTGALGLEAISRGAARATFVERHFPTARLIRDNARLVGVDESQIDVHGADTFIWVRRLPDLGRQPWLFLCSPPYDLYQSRPDDMLRLIEDLLSRMPPGSLFVVEADARFDFTSLPRANEWDVRSYLPAVVAVLRSPEL